MNRGSIHWAQLDKRRPCVIVSPDIRNQLANDVIVVPCSSQLRRMAWHVLLNPREGGIRQKSVVKCEQVMTLPKTIIEPISLGPPLSAARMYEVERALLLALGILSG
jgi:mRNA interferase MazF